MLSYSMKNFLFSLPILFRNGITFILFYYFADVLDKDTFGAFNLSFAYIVFLNSFLVLSLSSGFTRYFYEHDDGRYHLGFLLIVLGVISANALVVYSLRDNIFIDVLSHYSSLIIIVSVMSGLSELFLLKIRLDEKIRAFSVLNISILAIFMSLIFIFASDGLTLFEILLSYALQFSAVFIMFIFYLLRNTTLQTLTYIRDNASQYKKAVVFSLCILPGNFGYLLNDAVDKFVIADALTLGEVAIYSFTYQLGFIFLFVFSVLVKTVFTPFVLQHYKKDTTIIIINRIIKYFTISYVSIFLLALWLKEFAYSYFECSYAAGSTFLPMVMAAVFFAILSTFFVVSINLAEKPYFVPLIEVSSGVVNLILSLFLIPKYGIAGGFVSTYISLLFRMISYLVVGSLVYKKYKYNLLPVAIASLGMAAISINVAL